MFSGRRYSSLCSDQGGLLDGRGIVVQFSAGARGSAIIQSVQTSCAAH